MDEYREVPKWGLPGRLLLCAVDLINGLWSNYPPCCVMAWVADTWADRPHWSTRFRACVGDEDDLEAFDRLQYVPCERCFRQRRFRTRFRRGAIYRYALLRSERSGGGVPPVLPDRSDTPAG
jgi:hypothetical protein